MKRLITDQEKKNIFTRNFSKLNTAEYYEQKIDGKRKSDYLFALNSTLRKLYLKYYANPNDWELERIWKLKLNTTKKIVKYLQEKFSDDHLRKIEYAFEAECLIRKDVRKNILVDMGGGFSYSTIVPALFRFPKSRIISLDVIDNPRKSKYGIEYLTGNCMESNLPSNFADTVTMISMLEHVGLGRYGDPIDPDGDIKAIVEAKRVLKIGGHLILTIPYGYPTVVFNLHRVYDEGRMKKMMKGFKPVCLTYSFLGKICKKREIERKKVTKNISGYYEDVSCKNRVLNAQGGLLGLYKKI